ncbi:MAG: Ldh family oxidoreductase [Actinomycetota bacterium]
MSRVEFATAVTASSLTAAVAGLFRAAGADAERAELVAASLVDADREGVSSHGVMLAPMYVDRLRAGSVDPAADPEVVRDRDAVAVMDGRHGFGQVTGDAAMELAVGKALRFGVGVVAVRHGFHFGMARRYALSAASRSCVGIVSCNTRPLMPAPGGAERMVGNNPIAIAFPSAGEVPVVLDIALSEAAMGKVRMADAAGEPIPDTWATDSDGVPTTEPAAAISGMLLPVGGHKGFGLAFMLDLLAGVLSGGAWGDAVSPLYGDPAVPYDASHFFLAVHADHFRPASEVEAEVQAAAERIRRSRPAPGNERVFSPGQPEWERRRRAGEAVGVDPAVLRSLAETAAGMGIDPPDLEYVEPTQGGDDAQT